MSYAASSTPIDKKSVVSLQDDKLSDAGTLHDEEQPSGDITSSSSSVSNDNNASDASRYSDHELGKRGEDAAEEFLRRRGYEILERNWVCPAGEADIIALDDEAVRFIEVKTRRSTTKGFPEEAVNAQKRARYERIAEWYLRSSDDIPQKRITFDIISILVTSEHRAFLRMHRDVFSEDCC